jgi:hypothetical protein
MRTIVAVGTVLFTLGDIQPRSLQIFDERELTFNFARLQVKQPVRDFLCPFRPLFLGSAEFSTDGARAADVDFSRCSLVEEEGWVKVLPGGRVSEDPFDGEHSANKSIMRGHGVEEASCKSSKRLARS